MSELNTSQCRTEEEPFKYLVVKDFANREMILDINEKHISQMSTALYVTESVPQIYMQDIDPKSFVEGSVISIPCVTEFTETNKNHKGAKLKDIELKVEPSGQQAINRTFVDINNIDDFPKVQRLVDALVKPELNEFLMKTFEVDLTGTALRVELLRNGAGHFLTPHCDCVEKIITLLIFINENDQPLDSGTDIYRPKTGSGDTESSTLSRSFGDFEKVAEVPFVTGTALIFHPGENTWHGLDHEKTFTDRRLIQINWVSDEYSTHPECFPVQA